MRPQSKPHGLVYVAQCLANDKFYVGQTVQSLRDRWRAHGKPCNARSHGIFAKAVQKYGKENFEVQPVSEGKSKDQLDNLEKLWVILLRSSENDFGYNRTLGGDGSLNEQARQKMRGPRASSQKMKWKRSTELLEKLRQSNLGRSHSEAWCIQHAIDMTGFRHSEETKKKMSGARKRFWEKKRSSGLLTSDKGSTK